MANQLNLTIAIPEGLEFSALRLRRDPKTHETSFDWEPIRKICEASNIPFELIKESGENNLALFVVTWYFEHRKRGGAPDQVAEQIIAEVEAESVADIWRIQSTPGETQ